MATMTNSLRWGAAIASLLLPAAGLVAACSSNNSNPQPVTPVYGLEGGADVTTNDAPNGTDAAQESSVADAPAEAEAGEAAPPEDAAACTTDAGCWTCTPQTTPEFLNQCTTSQCSPFVNLQRLPDYDGSLPPLQ
jgi:hypothetical protein